MIDTWPVFDAEASNFPSGESVILLRAGVVPKAETGGRGAKALVARFGSRHKPKNNTILKYIRQYLAKGL